MKDLAGTMPEASHRKPGRPVLLRSRPKSATPFPARITAPPRRIALVHKMEHAPKVDEKKKEGGKKLATIVFSFWPVAVGLLFAGFASEWWESAAQLGVWCTRLLFPLALLATHREIGMDDQFASIAPHAALLLQFPLEGLLTKLTLDRGKTLRKAAVQLIGLHAVGAFVLWLLSLKGH